MRKILSMFAVGIASTMIAFAAAGIGETTENGSKCCAATAACSCTCGGDQAACTCPGDCTCDNCGSCCAAQ